MSLAAEIGHVYHRGEYDPEWGRAWILSARLVGRNHSWYTFLRVWDGPAEAFKENGFSDWHRTPWLALQRLCSACEYVPFCDEPRRRFWRSASRAASALMELILAC